jgi:hypothetical protein
MASQAANLVSREEAEGVLAEILEDEPELADVLYVVEVELESSAN